MRRVNHSPFQILLIQWGICQVIREFHNFFLIYLDFRSAGQAFATSANVWLFRPLQLPRENLPRNNPPVGDCACRPSDTDGLQTGIGAVKPNPMARSHHHF